MQKKHIRLICLTSFLLLSSFLVNCSASVQPDITPPEEPNILLITIDDLATRPMGLYGGQASTPNLDSIAAEGTLFVDAHTSAALCNPARISMLTGLRPSSTNITGNSSDEKAWRDYLANPDNVAYQNYGDGIHDIKTIFELFVQKGYFVANSGKTFHSGDQQNAEPWWNANYNAAFMVEALNAPVNGLTEYYESRNQDWGSIEDVLSPRQQYYQESDMTDYKVGRNALSIIQSMPDTKPFFVSVGFTLPHSPRYIPTRILNQYPLERIKLPAIANDDLDDIPTTGYNIASNSGNYYDKTYIFDNDTEWRQMVAHYLASITYVDEQIGLVMDALDQRHLLDNTIIIVWSDQGYHLGEKYHLGKYTLWEETTQMALIIKAPGITTPGSTVSTPVSSMDLFPTISALAGLPPPTDFPRDGRSLMPLLQDPDAYWPWPVVTFLDNSDMVGTNRVSIRTQDWAYIRYDLDNPGTPREEELYARVKDPFEWHNLLTANTPVTVTHVVTELESILLGQLLPDTAPNAGMQAIHAPLQQNIQIQLTGEDANRDYLLFEITDLPAHGQLFETTDGVNIGKEIMAGDRIIPVVPGWSVSIIYVPTDVTLEDSFEFSVSDGTSQAEATVNIAFTFDDSVFLPLFPVQK